MFMNVINTHLYRFHVIEGPGFISDDCCRDLGMSMMAIPRADGTYCWWRPGTLT